MVIFDVMFNPNIPMWKNVRRMQKATRDASKTWAARDFNLHYMIIWQEMFPGCYYSETIERASEKELVEMLFQHDTTEIRKTISKKKVNND